MVLPYVGDLTCIFFFFLFARTLAFSQSQTMDTVQQGLQLPDGTDLTPPSPKAMSKADGFDPLAQQLPEQSVQDLTGILSML